MELRTHVRRESSEALSAMSAVEASMELRTHVRREPELEVSAESLYALQWSSGPMSGERHGTTEGARPVSRASMELRTHVRREGDHFFSRRFASSASMELRTHVRRELRGRASLARRL